MLNEQEQELHDLRNFQTIQIIKNAKIKRFTVGKHALDKKKQNKTKKPGVCLLPFASERSKNQHI